MTSRHGPSDWTSGEGGEGIAALFEARVASQPGAKAVRFADEILTYEELNHRANRLAHRLQKSGVGPGHTVAVCLERSAHFITSLLAILKSGAAYLPLDPAFPAERIAFILRDAGARAVITSRDLEKEARVDGAALLFADASDLQNESDANLPAASNGASLTYVIYTSGSTGTPKGVCIPQSAVVRLVRDTDYVQLTPDDMVAQAANCAFDAATFEIWGPLLNGGSLAIIPQESVLSPHALIAEIERCQVTTLFLTTALFNQVARENPKGFCSLRTLLFGGEACDPRLVATVLREGAPQRLLHVYGPTETTTFALWHEVKTVSENATTVPIGRPIAGSEAHIDEAMGELLIGGAGLATGYLNRPELTAEKFVALENGERAYRTGDHVRMNENGEIEFIGRADFQVKIRGFRIELGEIETALTAHPAVRDAVVLAREDTPGEKRLAAYVTGTISANELRDSLREKLPFYMLPSAFVMLDRMPLNSNGKFDRSALPAPSEADVTCVAPSAKMEADILKIWRDVLSLERVGVENNFFDLGGNSLQLATVHARLEELLARKIPITALFQFPTIRALAAHLQNGVPPKSANPFLDRARRQHAALTPR